MRHDDSIMDDCGVGHRESELVPFRGEQGGKAALSAAKLAALKANIFLAGHSAIADWHTFDWHRQRGEITADRPNSSQALAIDIFGTIKAAPEDRRTAVLDAIAKAAGLPPGGPWEIELEWTDPRNLLHEPRPTQVDALAIGARAIMVIECKFTEAGGSCSQTRRLSSGPSAGKRQCNGRYEVQRHPESGIASRCALSGKGIRYWDVIPRLFELDPLADYDPCPFKGEAFQWMRNMVLASELGRSQGKAARSMIAYASGGGFPSEAKVKNLDWLPKVRGSRAEPYLASFQSIAALAFGADDDPRWAELLDWIDRKVEIVRAQRVVNLRTA